MLAAEDTNTLQPAPLFFSRRQATNVFVTLWTKVKIMEERLIELETKTAFLDHTIEELNDVIVKQQLELDQMSKKMDRMNAQLRLITSALPGEAAELA